MKERTNRSGKMPAFQFYPGDWLRDLGVRALSRHDRSVWFDLLCMMHDSERRGLLLLNGHAMTDQAIGNALALTPARWRRVKTQLLDTGVASVDEETGALISRRMVRDEELRQLRAENGESGGRPPRAERASASPESDSAQEPKPNQSANLNRTPSSSSSPSGEVRGESRGEHAPHTDLGPLVEGIVLEHPHARSRGWRAADIPMSVRVAVVDAIRAEVQATGSSPDVTAMVLREFVAGFGRLPPERARFITKDVAKWFELREYRADPALVGNQNDNQKGTKRGGMDERTGEAVGGSSRVAASVQRRNESRNAIWSAGKRRYGIGADDDAGADAVGVSKPDAAGGDPGYVAGAMGGSGDVLRGKPPGRSDSEDDACAGPAVHAHAG